MKLLRRFLVALVLFLILFFVGASVYVNRYGKDLIEETLESALSKNVDIEDVSYQFPLKLRVKNIYITRLQEEKKFFEVSDIIARLSIETIFRRQFIFNSVKLIKPVMIVEKSAGLQSILDQPIRRHGVLVPFQQSNPTTVNNASGIKEDQSHQAGISIKHFVLSRGRLQYINSSVGGDFSFAMEDVYLRSKNLAFPVSLGQTDFNITGRLIKEGNPLSGSSVEGRGWVDIVQKDMEVSIEIIEADGSVGMTAEAISKNNDMEVEGEIKFQNILMGAKKNDVLEISPVNDLIASALSSAGMEIGAQFSFRTKMDDFQMEKVSFSGNVVTK